jgi:hypothetical protein
MRFILLILLGTQTLSSVADELSSPRVNAGRWAKYAENFYASRSRVRALRGTPETAKQYAGALDESGLYNGYGQLKVSDGSAYIGDFRLGMFEGKGTLYSSNGDIYTGEFLKGEYNGHGSLTQGSTGNMFEGKFENGVIDGVGMLTFANGDKYHGNFRKGLFHGNVRGNFADGSTFQGSFENGILLSSGIHRSDAGTITFQGLRGSSDRDDSSRGDSMTTGGSVMTAEFS